MSDIKRKHKLLRLSVIGAVMLLLTALVAGCSNGFSSAGGENGAPQGRSSSTVRSNAEGSVTIALKWLSGEKGILVFQVAMDTHSVNLDQVDLIKQARLRDNTGQEYSPASWNAPLGGHHRSGTLTFDIPDSVKSGSARSFEIVIRDVAGIEQRVFDWDLSQG